MAFDYAAKIRNLLDAAEATQRTADRETDPEAAEGYRLSAAHHRAMAERLMDKYRVAEEEALAADADATAPISKKIVFCPREDSDLYYWYHAVFDDVARHTGVRVHTDWERMDERWVGVATVVGYEGDVRYTEFLWIAAYLMFTTRIDPVWDEARTERENIFLLRNAGIERRVIANRAWGNGDNPAARSKVQRIYLREAYNRGEQPRATGLSHNTDVYREAYARSFRDTLARRLQDARDATDSARGGLVLHGRSERVDEAFYTLFPHARPSTTPAGPAPECGDCKKTKHQSKLCPTHRPRKWTKADEARYHRRYNSPSARSGEKSGAHAADGVTITRGFNRPDRVEDGDRPAIG